MSKDNQLPTHIVHIFSGDLWAGAEVMIYHLLNQLHKAEQMRITAICLNDGILARKLQDARIKLYIIDESKHSFAGILIKIACILKDDKIDIVHSHRNKENLLAALLRFITRKGKLVATLHGLPEHEKSLKGRINKILNFCTLRLIFNHVVAVSADIHRRLSIQYNFRNDQTSILHNGIALPCRENGPPGSNGKNLHIGTVGRMVPVKDFGLFIDIAALLSNRFENVRFSILGDGPLNNTLRERVRALSLEDKITFMPLLEDPSSYYQSLDIYLNTSKHEGIPLSILEAMAFEKAVIAPDVGGIPEIIRDGVDGLLIKKRTVEAFAASCTYLLENSGLRLQLGRQARRRVEENFSASAMATRYIKLYNSLSNAQH